MKQWLKRALSLTLALLMVLGMAPMLATEAEAKPNYQYSQGFPLSTHRTYQASVLAYYSGGGRHPSYLYDRRWGPCRKAPYNENCLVDIPANGGEPIYAVADGVVSENNNHSAGGYNVVIKHDDGTYSYYGHMIRRSKLQRGTRVQAGTIIGYVGMTGSADGYHLHFEWSDHDPFCEFVDQGFLTGAMRNSGASIHPHKHCAYEAVHGDHNWGKGPDKEGRTSYGVCLECRTRFPYEKTFTGAGAGIYQVHSGEKLCAEPYDGTQNKAPGGNVMVIGTVTNAYGNQWYKTQDGSYIYPKDVDFVKALEQTTGRATAPDGLNINTNPRADSKIGVIPQGGAVTIYPAETADNGWLKVDYQGTKGFVSGNYIALDQTDRHTNLQLDTGSIGMKQGEQPVLHQYVSSKALLVYVNVKLDGASLLKTRPDQLAFALSRVEKNAKWSSLSRGSHTLEVAAMDAQGSSKTWTIPVEVGPGAMSQCAAPTFQRKDCAGGCEITINGPAGSLIHYEVDGVPGTFDAGGFVGIYESATLRAYASAPGMKDSQVSTLEITLEQLEAPAFEVSQTSQGAQVVLHTAQEAAIRWSTDGGESWQDYLRPLTFTQPTELWALATRIGCLDSDVATVQVGPESPTVDAVLLMLEEDVTKVPVGTGLYATWFPVPSATGYTLCFYHDDQLVWTQETQEVSCPVGELTEPGTYYFTVTGHNDRETGTPVATRTVTAMAPATVRFVDTDENGEELLLSEALVPYGQSATAPEPAPEHPGRYFLRWDQDFSRVTGDLVVKPVYKLITYTVEFKDHRGNVIAIREVTYNQPAQQPDPAALQGPSSFYTFTGWAVEADSQKSKCDLDHVDANLTAQAVFTWNSDTKPVGIRSLTADYNAADENCYYTVKVGLENTDRQFTKAVLRIALKTTDPNGVQKVVDTASQTVNLAKGSQSDYTFTMNYPGVAATVEAVVVGYEYDTQTGAAYSDAVTAKVQQVSDYVYGAFTDWSFTNPVELNHWTVGPDGSLVDEKGQPVEVEEKTVYRSREKETTTSTESTLPGWTYDHTTQSYGDWRNVGWTRTNPGSSDTVRVTDTRQVTDSNSYTIYHYYHYWGRNAQGVIYSSYGNGVWKNREDITSTTPLPMGQKYDGYQSYSKKVAGMHGTHWWLDHEEHVPAVTHTEWYYQTRNTYNTYHFYRWPAWNDGAWQDAPISGSANVEVQSATMYRYHLRNEAVKGDLDPTNEDTSGQVYRFTNVEGAQAGAGQFVVPGALPAAEELDLAGRKATILVYKGKNTDPNESQVQYVGQTDIGAGNAFSFSFIPKSGEPTRASGDYIVALSVEGSVGLVNIGRIPAPKPVYTVTYTTPAGEILSTQEVPEGGNAQAPAAPQAEGKNFITWSETGTNVHGDQTITAIYTPQVYAVTFVDWINNEAFPYASVYGTSLESLAQGIGDRTAEGYTFEGWDFAPEATVTGNQVINARYTPKTYTVQFYAGEDVIDTQQVAYGQSAVLPQAPDREDRIFLGWSTDTQWWKVTEDLDVAALYTYDNTTLDPQLQGEILLGEGKMEVTLTAEEGADIYYTLDGSAPNPGTADTETSSTKHYTGPFLLEQEAMVRAIAVMPRKNESEVVDVLFQYREPQEEPQELVELNTFQVQAQPGKDIVLKVNLEQNPGLVGYLFDIACDRSVFYLDEGEAGLQVQAGEASQSATSTLLCAGADSDGWQVLWFDTQESTAAGNLFTLVLHVSETAQPGTYPIRISYSPANTITEEDLELDDKDVNVEFGGDANSVTGDINGDGRVTTADVVLIARFIIEDYNFSARQLRAADTTGDGMVNAKDVVRLSRYLLGLAELG